MTQSKERINLNWKATKAEISEEGQLITVRFESLRNIGCYHEATMSADFWMRTQFSEIKLVELNHALTEAFNILKGRQ